MSQRDASQDAGTPRSPLLEEAAHAVDRGDHAHAREILTKVTSGEGDPEDLERVELALRHDSFGIGIAVVTGVTLLILAVLLF